MLIGRLVESRSGLKGVIPTMAAKKKAAKKTATKKKK
jgi:hypothetical protein